MKTFIRGILTTVLVFTFTLIPTIMYAEQIVNQEIIGTYGKEEVIKQMSESLKNEFPEITDENIKELEESLRTNETIDNLMNKYTDKIMKDLTTDEIEDINIEEDLKTLASAEEPKNIENTGNDLEKRLETILGRINGVGEVKVLITYSESNKTVAMYNENLKQSSTEENDTSGGTRKITETDTSKEIIYKEENGEKVPITEQIIMAKIEGAVITAKGAGNANVKANIIQAVEAATGIPTHKIQVFEMN